MEQLQKLKANESDSSSKSSHGKCVASSNQEPIAPAILSMALCKPEMDSGINSKDQQKVVDCPGKCGTRKEEKTKSKASKKVTRAVTCESSSSSSSSESSDSECDKIVDLENLKLGKIQPNIEPQKAMSPVIESTQALSGTKPMALLPTLGIGNKPRWKTRKAMGKISVAWEGLTRQKSRYVWEENARSQEQERCWRSFKKFLGIDGEVTGCKCMGKCKEGPNVKV